MGRGHYDFLKLLPAQFFQSLRHTVNMHTSLLQTAHDNASGIGAAHLEIRVLLCQSRLHRPDTGLLRLGIGRSKAHSK